MAAAVGQRSYRDAEGIHVGHVSGAAYAGSMLFSVVYLGEHYAVDAFAGWAAAGACWAGVRAVQRRLEKDGEEAAKAEETTAQTRAGVHAGY